MDTFSPEERSRIMRRVRGKDTAPELRVRGTLHRMGYRFRLHRRDLPGNPDIVLPKHRTVVFVHGCFWHRHPGCKAASTPAARQEYWLPKFERTVKRDRAARRKLAALGWRVIVIWECQTKDRAKLARKLALRLKRPIAGA